MQHSTPRKLRLLALALACTCAAPAAAQVGLKDLPEVAEKRAERLRPVQEEKMKPHWTDLALDPSANGAFLNEKYQEVAALGDGVIPLLLEKLKPGNDSEQDRHLAHNCANVLMRMDPAALTPSLLDLLAGDSTVARIQAARLLAKSSSAEAGARLTMELASARPTLARAIGNALSELRYRPAAPKVVAKLLASGDVRDRRVALAYLEANPAPEVLDAVVLKMATEKANALLGNYVNYIGKTGIRRADIATLLVELLNSNKLDAGDTIILIRSVGRVAPMSDKGILEKLLQRIGARTGKMARALAFAMRDLGSDNGIDLLKLNLMRALDDANNRRDPRLYEELGDLRFELDDPAKAIQDYKTAIKLEDFEPRRVDLWMKVARAEASRERWLYMVRAFKECNATRRQIQDLAAEDPNVQMGLLESAVQRYLDGLE